MVALAPSGEAVARRVAGALGAALHGREGRVAGDAAFPEATAHLRDLFAAGVPIVGVCAAGVLIRAVAPLLADKRAEPPVVAVAEDGSCAVPLLGGHRGANALARRVAEALGGVAAVTTAGDLALGVALDAPPAGWRLANPEDAGAAMAAALAGGVRVEEGASFAAVRDGGRPGGSAEPAGRRGEAASRGIADGGGPSSGGSLSLGRDAAPGEDDRLDEGAALWKATGGTASWTAAPSRDGGSLPGASPPREATEPTGTARRGGEATAIRMGAARTGGAAARGPEGPEASPDSRGAAPLSGGVDAGAAGAAGRPDRAAVAVEGPPDAEGAAVPPPDPGLRAFPFQLPFDLASHPDGAVTLLATEAPATGGPGRLVYHPLRHVLGLGCARGADPEALWALVGRVLGEAGVAPGAVAAVATVALKADEPAVLEAARRLGAPLRLFDAAALEAETPRLAHPSEVVFAAVGAHGVAEAAALACAGPDAALSVPKRKTGEATCALARAPAPLTAPGGRPRGRLSVVGIGPGRADWRTPEASRAVASADELVGYGLYIDLLGPLAMGRPRADFPLGGEEARCRHALERAGRGSTWRWCARATRASTPWPPWCSSCSTGAGFRTRRGAWRSRWSPACRRCRRPPRAPARRSGTTSAPSRCRTC